MNDWQTLLRDADAPDVRLDPAVALRIRNTVVHAALDAAAERSPWGVRLALAGFAALVMALSAIPLSRAAAPNAPPLAPVAGERRQIQFSTPGGTRIIWELNPRFDLTETTP